MSKDSFVEAYARLTYPSLCESEYDNLIKLACTPRPAIDFNPPDADSFEYDADCDSDCDGVGDVGDVGMSTQEVSVDESILKIENGHVVVTTTRRFWREDLIALKAEARAACLKAQLPFAEIRCEPPADAGPTQSILAEPGTYAVVAAKPWSKEERAAALFLSDLLSTPSAFVRKPRTVRMPVHLDPVARAQWVFGLIPDGILGIYTKRVVEAVLSA